MTEETRSAYNAVDLLQLKGDYEELNQLAQYVVDAIINDDEMLTLVLPAEYNRRRVKS